MYISLGMTILQEDGKENRLCEVYKRMDNVDADFHLKFS